MPLLNTLATPYADALLQVTESKKESEIVAKECKELLEIWESSEEFRDAMISPVLEPDSKKKVLELLLANEINQSLLNLLKVLADRQRLIAFDSVLFRFIELYRQQQGITLAKVCSAKALSEDQKSALKAKVQIIAGSNKVDIDLSVDSSLIGGFVVSLGSQVIDASLAGQVRRLGLVLSKTN